MTKLHAIGTSIIAIKDVGVVRDGQPGIITGIGEQKSFLRNWPVYMCTFLGNVRVDMKPGEVDDHPHGYSIQQLSEPEDKSLSVAEQLRQIMPR